jgi:hypothetical protein
MIYSKQQGHSIFLRNNTFLLASIRFLIAFFLLCLTTVNAQVGADSLIARDALAAKDSVAKKDTVPAGYPVSKMPDAAQKINPDIMAAPPQLLMWEILKRNAYFGFSSPLQSAPPEKPRIVEGKELLFYLLVFLFILLAFFKNIFPKYFNDLFRLFFRTTLKQKQIRGQLMQTPLPSLLLNGFFVLSAALYTGFLVQHYRLAPAIHFWLIFLYACIVLSGIYLIKFAGLKAAGWVFNIPELVEDYIFIVFIINKMIGILLLPFLLLLAFSTGAIYSTGLLLSYCLLGGLLLYRFVLSYIAVRNGARLNPFHFFLYICAFEIVPLLLIYKGLLLFFGITA